MAAPRVVYAMARKGSFFTAFGRLHPRFGSPVNAILLQTALSLLVLAFGAFDRVLAFIIFSAVIFLALTVSTLFRLERAKSWWYPAAPLLFMLFCVVLDVLILLHDPIPALIGVAIVLCGIPCHRVLLAFGSGTAVAAARE
jgi:basic amino acid/polyamine antiporter, APA family